MSRLSAPLSSPCSSAARVAWPPAASVGSAAPDFSLTDLAGKPVKLSDYKGKYVVLEWVNPGCPFVQKHYDSGNMPRLQKDAAAQGVAWLTVDSTKSSHENYESAQQLGSWLKQKGAAPTEAMLDPDGKVGKLYGAKATPHMFIVDPKGTLVYAGAIDSIRTAEAKDIKNATNFVKVALAESMAGKPVAVSSTQAYGCPIKY